LSNLDSELELDTRKTCIDALKEKLNFTSVSVKPVSVKLESVEVN